jgi:HSP20 family molecular chaperone IbpA
MTWKPSSSQIDSISMNQVMNTLDKKSVQILIYLLKERHAGIRKLADLINASSDMEVLVKIMEVINPKVRETMGQPLIIFERSKLDPLTGEKITFSWWLNEELIDDVPNGKLLDFHDEKDTLRVVASIPLQEEDVKVEVKDNILIIAGKKYYQEVLLTSAVEGNVKKTVNNGVLEVVLKKSGEKTW